MPRLRSRDQPLYRYLIKVEVLERYRVGALLGSRLHCRWPKVADVLIKAHAAAKTKGTYLVERRLVTRLEQLGYEVALQPSAATS